MEKAFGRSVVVRRTPRRCGVERVCAAGVRLRFAVVPPDETARGLQRLALERSRRCSLLGYLIVGLGMRCAGGRGGVDACAAECDISGRIGGHFYPGLRVRIASRSGAPGQPALAACRRRCVRRVTPDSADGTIGAGWLTNYWIVSGLLLGFGQVLGLRRDGSRQPVGRPPGNGFASACGASAGSHCGFRAFRKEVPPAGRPASFRRHRRRRPVDR